MTAFFMRSWPSLPRLLLLLAGLWLWPLLAQAGAIEVVRAQLNAGDEAYTLAAEFDIDLGPRLEEAVSRGVPLYFSLECTLDRKRWYWANEHIASVSVNHRLSYNALTRQYRLATGSFQQHFATLAEALRALRRVGALPVADRHTLKPGEVHYAAVRLSLDQSQLPKPFQVDAIANRDWRVDAATFRWEFVPERVSGEGR